MLELVKAMVPSLYNLSLFLLAARLHFQVSPVSSIPPCSSLLFFFLFCLFVYYPPLCYCFESGKKPPLCFFWFVSSLFPLSSAFPLFVLPVSFSVKPLVLDLSSLPCFPPACWGLSLAFIKPEKVLCPGLQKWRASWRREIVATGMAS